MRGFSKIKSLRLKCFIFTIVLLSVYLFLFYVILMEVWMSYKNRPVKTSSIVLPYVVVHLDFKGSPPKILYLESLLPELKNLGVNGFLMEYEDMFPYTGKLVNISSKNCYQKAELRSFLKKASNAGFEIIPLIQTFGHMEHVLKLEEFQKFREMPRYPDSICPSKIESINLIREMLEQVIAFHDDVFQLNYIHIGFDEVYHINNCYQCARRGIGNIDIYFKHLETVTKVVKNLSSHTKVLIWDDMLRGIKPMKWNTLGYMKGLDPVYWNYSPNVRISHIDLMNYHKYFDGIWIATAFKGADGRAASMPDLKARFLNHYNWLNHITDYKFGGEDNVYNFKGIILTGWSRYSHMDPPCELLPVAIPSLILNLQLIREFQLGGIIHRESNELDFDTFFKRFLNDNFNRNLKCKPIIDGDYAYCDFETRDLYVLVKEYVNMCTNIEKMLNSEESGLASVEFYAKINYINMNNVEHHIKKCERTINNLENLEAKLSKAMTKYYDEYFIVEYINSKTYAVKMRLKAVKGILDTYLKHRIWERRSYIDNSSLILN